MTTDDNKAVARRVLEEIFPANDVEALREVISDQFVNHEAPPGTPPGLGAGVEHEEREQGSLLAAPEGERPTVVHHLDRAEDAELHACMVRKLQGTRNTPTTGWRDPRRWYLGVPLRFAERDEGGSR